MDSKTIKELEVLKQYARASIDLRSSHGLVQQDGCPCDTCRELRLAVQALTVIKRIKLKKEHV